VCGKFGVDEILNASTNFVNGLCDWDYVVSIAVTLQVGIVSSGLLKDYNMLKIFCYKFMYVKK
jgi:hypothetical protein